MLARAVPASALGAAKRAALCPRMRTALGAVLVLLAACRPAATPTAGFRALAEEWWAMELAADPLRATAAGEHRYDDLLPFESLDSLRARAERRRAILARLEAVPIERLERGDQVSHRMMAQELTAAIRDFEFGAWQMPILADDGFHIGFARLPDDLTFSIPIDYQNYLARLAAYPRYSAENIANMREGLRTGFTMPAVVLDGYDLSISAHLVDDITQSVFWRPFTRFPAAVSEADRDALSARAKTVITEQVIPAYRAFLEFIRTEYRPKARPSIGAAELPNGRSYYAWLVEKFTTLPLTPDSVHRLGRSEVARIRAEMDAEIEATGFKGTFDQFLRFLRTDPRFYAPTPAALLKEAAWLAKTADGMLPSLFTRLPRQPYTVAPVPDEIAPKYTGGRYLGAPLDGVRPGTYWVNTYNLPSRTLYTLPALTLHEAVPGHHLQAALAKEQSDLPAFRRHTYVNAFGEGWGLYAEFLGIEMGMYRTPYDRFGRLTYEMWRACRLVVDTGIHAMGWSRQQALDYLGSNTALSLHEVGTEIDRYISWPGQALAYKLGELKFRELRRHAEATLGPRFDVRRFHDLVLGQGTVPLGVLEEIVRAELAPPSTQTGETR
jgi:uncharacterized protein (DUF885 family)